MFQEKLLGQSQWKDYSGPLGPPPGHHAPPPHHNYGYDAFETEAGVNILLKMRRKNRCFVHKKEN